MLNITVFINQNITATLLGVAKQTLRLTHQDWKLNKTNHASTCSSVWIAKEIVRQIQTCALFGNIDSIRNGIQRNTRKSEKVERI